VVGLRLESSLVTENSLIIFCLFLMCNSPVNAEATITATVNHLMQVGISSIWKDDVDDDDDDTW